MYSSKCPKFLFVPVGTIVNVVFWNVFMDYFNKKLLVVANKENYAKHPCENILMKDWYKLSWIETKEMKSTCAEILKINVTTEIFSTMVYLLNNSAINFKEVNLSLIDFCLKRFVKLKNQSNTALWFHHEDFGNILRSLLWNLVLF